jgi:hypothetical protein
MTEKPFQLNIEYENKQGIKGSLEVKEVEDTLSVKAVDTFPDGKYSELLYKTQKYDTGRIMAKYNQIKRITKKKDKHVAAVLMAILKGE